MVREDWAQQGTAMRQSSDTIRLWLKGDRTVYVVGKPEMFNDDLRSADRETAMSISGSKSPGPIVGFAHLTEIASHERAADLSIVALHPYATRDCEALREVVDSGRLGKAYVHPWARDDVVRHWLEGMAAVDLHVGAPAEAPDPVQLEACKLMVNQEYNGLASGNGKATVIQLLRSFATDGYPLDTDQWLRAYFAAGGSFSQAEVVKKYVREVLDGKHHRVSQRFRPQIVSILRERVAEGEASGST